MKRNSGSVPHSFHTPPTYALSSLIHKPKSRAPLQDAPVPTHDRAARSPQSPARRRPDPAPLVAPQLQRMRTVRSAAFYIASR